MTRLIPDLPLAYLRTKALLLLGIALLVAAQNAKAQIPQKLPNSPGRNNGFQQNGNSNNPFAQDSTKQERKGGKILDDSTQVVYGPSTTSYIREADWFRSTGKTYLIDTGLTNFQRYNYVAVNEFKRLDLGNVGSPNQPIFLESPTHAGTRLGMDALSVYDVQDEDVRYFDTKSPHTDWYYVQGGTQRFWVDVTFAQNITPNMNVGVRYRRVSGPLLTGAQLQSRAVRQARRQEFAAFYRYESPNGRYKLLTNGSFFGHDLVETGGLIIPEGTERLTELFDLEPRELSNQLEGVDGYLTRQRLHVYHQYEVIDSTGLQVWHRFTTHSQESGYTDNNIDDATHEDFYPEKRFDDDRAYHRARYDLLENQVGVKQRTGRLFYAGYYKLRQYKFATKYSPDSQIPYEVPAEHFIGGSAEFTISDSLKLTGDGEFLLYEDFNYRFTIENSWLRAYLRQSFVSPTLLQRFHYSVFYQWNRSFVNTLTTEIGGELKVNVGEQTIRPFVSVKNVNDYVYFDQEGSPQQEGEPIQIVQAGFRSSAKLGKFFNESYFLFTENGNESAIRMPRWFANSTFYFQDELFKNAILVRFGLDFHYKSSFRANAYMPLTQVFHLQDDYEIGDYLYTDVFVTFRLNRVRMFFKVADALHGIVGPGYYQTPGYMGQDRDFEFGVVWQLFD